MGGGDCVYADYKNGYYHSSKYCALNGRVLEAPDYIVKKDEEEANEQGFDPCRNCVTEEWEKIHLNDDGDRT